MALVHTVTTDDVTRIYAEHLAAGRKPAEALQGTRTEVHSLIHAQNPTPLPLPPPSRVFNLEGIVEDADGYRVHDAALAQRECNAKDQDHATRVASLFGQLTPEVMIASERARTGRADDHKDAIHFVQKQHGKDLWAATDVLVDSACQGIDSLLKQHLAERASQRAVRGGGAPPTGGGLAREALDRECSGLAIDLNGCASIAAVDPFEPLREFAGKVWGTAKEAMEDIARLLGGQSFSWSNSGETSVWDLVFQNTNFAQAPVIQGSSSAGSFYISLHTANPGQTGSQTTSEAGYTSYARVAVARSSGGWTISGNNPINAVNAAAITFPAATGGSETETYFAFGSLTSGAGVVYGFGALTSSLAVSNGITPSFAISALTASLT